MNQQSMLGPFRLGTELGSGGMGTVHLAEDRNGRKLAIKIVHPHLLKTPGFFKRFLREAEIGKQVRHENIVRTLDVDAGEFRGEIAHYLVMEYVHGQTLRQMLEETRPLPESLCRHIALQVAHALAAIHRAGVIHRDLKPENVLITDDHVLKVMDLGVARLVDEALHLSESGAFLGSIRYAAPEQWAAGTDLDGRADLYSLGVMLYELCGGRHPNPQTGAQPPRPLSDVNPQVSAFFEELVETLMQADPAKRFGSADELAVLLEAGEASSWWQMRAAELREEGQRPLRRVRIPRATDLYGRDEELATLRRWFEDAKRGEGRVVLVRGEAGIGKTRLIDEFVARLSQDHEEFHFLFGSYPPGGAATAAGAFSTAYREHFGRAGLETALRRHLPDMPGVAPAFAALLRGEPGAPGSEPLTTIALQSAFQQVNRSLSGELPTIVFIDDLHFAPSEGLALFASLIHGLEGSRTMIIGSARRGLPADWLASVERLEPVRRMELARLGARDLVKLLRDAFGSERVAREVGWQIAEKTDGNPYFIFEVLGELRRQGLLTETNKGSWITTGHLREIAVPASVQELIRARVSSLETDEREFLELAACAGFEFDPTLVAEAAGLDLLPALKMCSRIEANHYLIRAAGDRYRFDHHQVQETMYQGLFERLREEYHAALARALEERAGGDPTGEQELELCRHYLAGRRSDQAIPFAKNALVQLEQNHLRESIVDLADRLLAAPLPARDRLDVLGKKAQALEHLARSEDEQAVIDEMLGLAKRINEPDAWAMVETLQGGVLLRVTPRREEAIACAERALAYAESAGSLSRLRKAEQLLGTIYYRMGRMEESAVHYLRAIGFAREEGADGIVAGLRMNLGMTYAARGNWEQAEELYVEALKGARRHGYLRAVAFTCSSLGRLRMQQGRYDEALEFAREFRRKAWEAGDIRGALGAAAATATILSHFGALDEMEEELEHARQLAQWKADPFHMSYVIQTLATVAEERGELDQALELHTKALDLRGEKTELEGAQLSHIEMGRILLRKGDEEGARRHFDRAVELDNGPRGQETTIVAESYRALFDEDQVAAVADRLATTRPAMGDAALREADFVLWRASGSRDNLARAHASVERLLEQAPPEYRDSVLEGNRLNREIERAWREA